MKFFSLLSLKVWFIRLKFKIYKVEPWLSIVCLLVDCHRIFLEFGNVIIN